MLTTKWLLGFMIVTVGLVFPVAAVGPVPGESNSGPAAIETLPALAVSEGENGRSEWVEEFLATATVTQVEELTSGTTRPLKLTLQQGETIHPAVFRHVHVYLPKAETREGIRLNYRDSAIFECAAYRLARLFGIEHVPPTVVREFGPEDFVDESQLLDFPTRKGTVQWWVSSAMTEKDRREKNLHSPAGLSWMRQFQELWLFDALIFNEDRNQGNILIDPDWKVWFIDATRAFRPFKQLQHPSRVELCEEETWRRLQEVPDAAIESALQDLLSGSELRSLLARRRALVEHLEREIQKRGEASVLFAADDSGSVPEDRVSQ